VWLCLPSLHKNQHIHPPQARPLIQGVGGKNRWNAFTSSTTPSVDYVIVLFLHKPNCSICFVTLPQVWRQRGIEGHVAAPTAGGPGGDGEVPGEIDGEGEGGEHVQENAGAHAGWKDVVPPRNSPFIPWPVFSGDRWGSKLTREVLLTFLQQLSPQNTGFTSHEIHGADSRPLLRGQGCKNIGALQNTDLKWVSSNPMVCGGPSKEKPLEDICRSLPQRSRYPGNYEKSPKKRVSNIFYQIYKKTSVATPNVTWSIMRYTSNHAELFLVYGAKLRWSPWRQRWLTHFHWDNVRRRSIVWS